MTSTLFGYEVAGDVRLLRARAGRGPRGHLRLRASDSLSALDDASELVLSVESPDARVRVSRADGGLLVACSLTGNYMLEPGELRVTFDGSPGDPAWEHRLVSTIVPLLLAEHGDLVMHASAVLGPRGAIIFCGPSGRGKSTTAAALATHGYPVLADDGSVITALGLRPRVWPGPAGVVIGEDVMLAAAVRGPRPPGGETWRGRRVHVPLDDGGAPEAADIAAVVLLAKPGDGDGDGDGAEPRLIDPADAVPALMPSAFRIDASRAGWIMRSIAQLAERVPVYRVRLADDLPVALEQARAVADRISGRSAVL